MSVGPWLAARGPENGPTAIAARQTQPTHLEGSRQMTTDPTAVPNCPDCEGLWGDHAEQCPVLAAIERQCADEAASFKKYPQMPTRATKPARA